MKRGKSRKNLARKAWWKGLSPDEQQAYIEKAVAKKGEERKVRLADKLAAQRAELIAERKRILGPDWWKTPPFELTPEEIAS